MDAAAAANTSLSAVKIVKSGGEKFCNEEKQSFAKLRGNQALAGSFLSTTKSWRSGWTPRLQPDGSLNMEIATNFGRK